MSYIPTNWKAGDTVTSAKLNKIEQGIATSSGTLFVHTIEPRENPDGGLKSGSGQKSMSNSNSNQESAYILDKTWQEIYDAAQVGNVILVIEREDEGMTYYSFIPLFGLAVASSEDLFIVFFNSSAESVAAYAYSADGTLIIGEPPEEDNNENGTSL